MPSTYKRILTLLLLSSLLIGAIACTSTRQQNGVIIEKQRSWIPFR